MTARVGVVVIGRNEGERLRASLRSLGDQPHVVYVDSGSDDGSQELARSVGVTVADLHVPPAFTAGRARNRGVAVLLEAVPGLEYIQMVDGDSTVEPGWIETGVAALDGDPGLAGVFGRLAEVAPNRSLYNRLCDLEWDVPVGPVRATGGNAMFRVAALRQVGSYAEALVAGEEPDLCLRMTVAGGWRFARLDAAMGRHDAAMTRFAQWWTRARRAGYAAGEHVARHRAAALPGDVAQVRRMLIWGIGLPVSAAVATALSAFYRAFGWWAAAVVALYLLQILRLASRGRALFPSVRQALAAGGLGVLHQVAAASGLIAQRLRQRPRC